MKGLFNTEKEGVNMENCINSNTMDIQNKFSPKLISEIQNTFVNNKEDYTIDEIAYALHRQIELCRYKAEIDSVL